MKKIKLLLAVMVISTITFAQYRNVALQAAGLTCSMCSNAINKALKPLPFINGIETDLKNNLFIIAIKPGMTPDFDLLKKKVEDAGFSVASLKVTGNFSDVSVQKDKHLELDGKNFHFISSNDKVLNGEQTFTIVDKDFLSAKEYKKFSAATKMECIKTGKAGNCCVKDGMHSEERVYHVII